MRSPHPLGEIDPIMGRAPWEEGYGLTAITLPRLPVKYLEVVE